MMMRKKTTSMGVKMVKINKNEAEADREKVGDDDAKFDEDDKIN